MSIITKVSRMIEINNQRNNLLENQQNAQALTLYKNNAENKLEQLKTTLQQFTLLKYLRDTGIVDFVLPNHSRDANDALDALLGPTDNVINQLLMYAAHYRLGSAIDDFLEPYISIISVNWDKHKEQLQQNLPRINDLQTFAKILPAVSDLIAKIRISRQLVYDGLKNIPESINDYKQVIIDYNTTVRLKEKLYTHFPDEIRDFFNLLDSDQGAGINDFTPSIKSWYERNELIDNLCIKPRQQNG